MVRLPTDLLDGKSYAVYIWYRFSTVEANEARLYCFARPLKTGETPGTLDTSYVDVTADSTTLRKTMLRSAAYTYDDEFLQLYVGRSGSSGSDDFTGSVYLYGIEVIINYTLGY